jgi:GTP cyclohydrolase I
MLINNQITHVNKLLPDVADSLSDHNPHALSWVGMDQIDLPVTLALSASSAVKVNCKVNCYVSLDNEQAKGIHMSRLYRILNNYASRHTFTPDVMQKILNDMIISHRMLSCDALISLTFDLPLLRTALITDNEGWKFYQVEIKCQQTDGFFSSEIKVVVTYSSTCPCSASLSRKLLTDKIRTHFQSSTIDVDTLESWLTSDAGSVATPHSQRSLAYLKTRTHSSDYFLITDIIDLIEDAISTPVQTAVKREDEQEFARLNGENLMFCEDAARRIKTALKNTTDIDDFWFKVEHQESLHAHNAVAIAIAGLPGGYQASTEF